MSQIFEERAGPFSVRCSDIGLACNCIVFGMTEKQVMDETVIHMFEYHAIDPEEMTTCMRLKIKENIRGSDLSTDTFLREEYTIPRIF